MKYKTMNRKELAAALGVSAPTLWRRMKSLDPEFLEHIKGKSLLLENEVRFIHESIEWRKPSEIGLNG